MKKETKEPTARRLDYPQADITEYTPVNIGWMVKHFDSYRKQFEEDPDSVPEFMQADNDDGTLTFYEIRGTAEQRESAMNVLGIHRLFSGVVIEDPENPESLYKEE